MDYTREVLGEIHSENGEGNGDEIVDEGNSPDFCVFGGVLIIPICRR